jgi:uncharacterized protein with FMN-binding domain
VKFKLFIVAAAAVVLTISGCVDTNSIVIKNPELSALRDGAYEGQAQVGPVKARVRIEVASGRIFSFTILEHKTMLGRNAERLGPLVVEKQTLALDSVSGATASSKALLKAAENALESAQVK